MRKRGLHLGMNARPKEKRQVYSWLVLYFLVMLTVSVMHLPFKAKDCVSKSIPFIVRDNELYVQAGLPSGQQIECFFDTGSWSTIIDNSLLEQLPVVGVVDVTGGFGETIQREVVHLDIFSVGPFVRSPFEVLKGTHPLKRSLLGLEFFSDHILELDFISNKISILESLRPQFSDCYDLVPSDELIQMHVCINKDKLLTFFDSGASISAIDSDYISKNEDHFVYLKDLNGGDITQTNRTVKLYEAKELEVGDVFYKNIKVVSIDFSAIRKAHPNFPQFFLGYNLMKDYVWSFDRKNSKWNVEKISRRL